MTTNNMGDWRFFIEILRQSLLAINDNRLRTGLSVIGVMLGIAAVMVVGSISEGGKLSIYAELETFGLRSIWIFRDYVEKDPTMVRVGTGIDNDDYLAIDAECCPDVKRVTPIIRVGRQPLIHRGGKYTTANLYGVNEDYLDINNDSLAIGRPLRGEDIRRRNYVAIIGSEVQKDLFDDRQNPIGQEILIEQYKFIVVGVLSEKNRDFLASIGSADGKEANGRIMVPYNVFQIIFGRAKDINTLQVESAGLQFSEAAQMQIVNFLNRRHSGAFVYKAKSMEKYIDTTNAILDGVSLIGIIAASVSLLVGGIGIMNIMSTSVLERTREIGLRKAIGARKKDILIQFLLEAVLISGFGGVLGLAVGVAASSVLALVTGFPLATPWVMVFVGLAISVGVGLASGYYPAVRAAALQPTAALRHE